MSDDSDDDEGGKGRPPRGSQFKPGQSGNPKGRPRGKRARRPEDVVLDQIVTVRENGVERIMRADAAFLLQLATKGLAGGGSLARAALTALDKRPLSQPRGSGRREITARVYAEPGDLRDGVRVLKIATMLDSFRPTARLALETWAVEAALARLGDRQLTIDEQGRVVAATRMPHKVRWPEWWTVKPP